MGDILSDLIVKPPQLNTLCSHQFPGMGQDDLPLITYSTVTLFARFRGLSISRFNNFAQ